MAVGGRWARQNTFEFDREIMDECRPVPEDSEWLGFSRQGLRCDRRSAVDEIGHGRTLAARATGL
jgi:hypothetical protein